MVSAAGPIVSSVAPQRFPYVGARSGSLTAGFALAIAVETAVVHLWLGARYPAWAWSLTALGVLSLAWIVAEYRAMGREGVEVRDREVQLRVTSRLRGTLPIDALEEARAFSWRDVPERPDGTYVNAMAPAEPNVLLRFSRPVSVALAWGLVRRDVTRVALRVDDPSRFLAVLHDSMS